MQDTLTVTDLIRQIRETLYEAFNELSNAQSANYNKRLVWKLSKAIEICDNLTKFISQ